MFRKMNQKFLVCAAALLIYAVAKAYVSITPTKVDDQFPDFFKDHIIQCVDVGY